MEAFKRRLRVSKLHLARLRDQMNEIAKGMLSIELLSKLESYLDKFRIHKQEFDTITEQLLSSIEESDSYEAPWNLF